MKNNLEILAASIAKRTNDRLSKEQLLLEMALLFLWKFTKKLNSGDTAVSNVIISKTSIATVYDHLDEELFNTSELPKILSPIDTEELLKELEEHSIIDVKEWENLFYKLALNTHMSFSGEIALQKELVELMYKLSKSENKDVYVPYSSSFQLAVKSCSTSNVTFGTDRELPFFRVFAKLTGFISKQLRPGDVWAGDLKIGQSDNDKTDFENILCVFPFVLRANKAFESLSILINVRCKKRAVILVSEGVLFRGADELKFRKEIIESDFVEAVIHLPTPSIYNTSIPLSLLVIDKTRKPNTPIIFYDADDEELYISGGRGKPEVLIGWDKIAEDLINKKESPFCRFVKKEEINENNYDLSVRRYVLGDASSSIRNLKNTKSLSDIAELIRGQLLKEDKTSSGEFFYEVGVKDIGENGILNKPKKKLQLTDKMKDRAAFQKLNTGDILLVSKGSVGKVALVGEDCGDDWVASQSFQIVRLKHHKSINKPEYLFSYLSSSLVQQYWSEQVTGTSIPVLKTTDIKELPIPILSFEEQQSIVATFTQVLNEFEEIKRIQEKISNLRKSNWTIK